MINTGNQIGSINPNSGSGLSENEVNILIGDYSYSKNEVDTLLSSSGSDIRGVIEIYEDSINSSNKFDTAESFGSWIESTGVYYTHNYQAFLDRMQTGNSYNGATLYYVNGTANENNKAITKTLLPGHFMKLSDMNLFEIENRVCLLEDNGSKAQNIKFGLGTSSYISNADMSGIYMEYTQESGVLKLISKNNGSITSVTLKTFTDSEAKLFNKLKITYDGNFLKGFVNGIELGSIDNLFIENIPTSVLFKYCPYQVHISTSGVLAFSFLDYFYAKFKFNY